MPDIFPAARGPYPQTRQRRNRRYAWLRELVAETELRPQHLIWPIFVTEGTGVCEPIASMPGVNRLSIDSAVQAARQAVDLGIAAVAVFPVVPGHLKTDDAKEALSADNLMCRSIHAIASAVGSSLGIVADVALDPYTSHGQDGLIERDYVVNDATIEVLCQQAINQAAAGCSCIAPSDMMDGRIAAVRVSLDGAGHSEVSVMAYAAKYASAFYGPFRDAVGSAGNLGGGNKKTYQMDPRNSDEAIHEVAADLAEGADIVMVKPGMPYLDIIRRIHDAFGVPVTAYQVSGEYAMLQHAAAAGSLNLHSVMLESLYAFRRAGASGILTYFAPTAAKILNGG